jgi:hypothetical protein
MKKNCIFANAANLKNNIIEVDSYGDTSIVEF